MNSDSSRTEASGTSGTFSGVVGIVLYLALGFLHLTSGLVVPLPGLVVLWVVWVAGWYLVVRLFRIR